METGSLEEIRHVAVNRDGRQPDEVLEIVHGFRPDTGQSEKSQGVLLRDEPAAEALLTLKTVVDAERS